MFSSNYTTGQYRDYSIDNLLPNGGGSGNLTCFAIPKSQLFVWQTTFRLPKENVTMEEKVISDLKTCCLGGEVEVQEGCGYTCFYIYSLITDVKEVNAAWAQCVEHALDDRKLLNYTGAKVQSYESTTYSGYADENGVVEGAGYSIKGAGSYVLGLSLIVSTLMAAAF